MKIALNITRVIVGILFIFSGLVKANDPLGLSYKMQEFFEVWNMHFLNDYSFALSFAMILFEIVAGVAVLLGWQFRLFSWLLFLLIVFFTFLTGYAVFSGSVRECGCFGDCIKLKAEESFLKDILLFFMTGFLLIKRNSIRSVFNSMTSAVLLLLSAVFTIGLQWYALVYLPVVDCLPYKKNAVIQEKMKIPEGATPDSTVITFVYNKGGKEVEFDASNFPEDFSDSLYTFVKRYDKLVREGNAKPEIKDFVILSPSGNDTTMSILEQPGKMLILFTREISPDNNNWIPGMTAVMEKAKQLSIPVLVVSSDADRVKSLLSKEKIDLPVCKGDLVAIKTAARSNPTLYLLEQGRIINKWGKGSFEKVNLQLYR